MASRAALLAFGLARLAVPLGCWYDVDDPSTPGGAGAAGGLGGSATSGAGGITSPPCTDPGAGCEIGCPPGIECKNGCCELPPAPAECGNAIDVTAGGRFKGSVCGGPPPLSNLECHPASPYLLLRVEAIDGGATAFRVEPYATYAKSLGIALPCPYGECLGSPPWAVDAGTTFAFETADDPCDYFVFDVKPQ